MDASAQPGHLVSGRYRLVAEIGSGGMGRVWKAVDEQLGRTVAVKQMTMPVLPPAQQAVRLEQAMREGKNAAAIADHPNIVTVHDVIIEGGAPWIIMQMVQGKSLRAVLRADPLDEDKITPLGVETVSEIAEALLSALTALDNAKMVHRDIKPGNILVADDGRILLTDFGLAKAETDATVTVSGSVMGTMAYLAPERAEGESTTIKADLFSLGVTLFEAVEGTSPFFRDSNTATLTAILVKPLPPMQRAGRLAPLIEALTLKTPEQRPDLDQAMALLKGSATTWEPPSPDDAATEAVPPRLPPGNRSKMPWQSVSLTASAGLPRPPVIDTPHRPVSGVRESMQVRTALVLFLAGLVTEVFGMILIQKNIAASGVILLVVSCGLVFCSVVPLLRDKQPMSTNRHIVLLVMAAVMGCCALGLAGATAQQLLTPGDRALAIPMGFEAALQGLLVTVALEVDAERVDKKSESRRRQQRRQTIPATSGAIRRPPMRASSTTSTTGMSSTTARSSRRRVAANRPGPSMPKCSGRRGKPWTCCPARHVARVYRHTAIGKYEATEHAGLLLTDLHDKQLGWGASALCDGSVMWAPDPNAVTEFDPSSRLACRSDASGCG